jgi:alcohol dehydrogenase (NADP+)
MLRTKAYAASHVGANLEPFAIERRSPGPHDVLFDVLYCGICHSDVHFVRGDFPGLQFPAVPGHEIIGRVTQVGNAVSRHRVGDLVGVGCLVDSCRSCPECEAGEEQFCDSYLSTYGSPERDGRGITFGGYSERMTVDERYVLKIAPDLSLAGAAPLLCAGITTYAPLRHWGVKKGTRVAVVGLGGLGHLAVKLAAAMGADVTVFSTSERKMADAQRLGAKEFVATADRKTFAQLAGRFDLILNTVSATVDYDAFIKLLKRDGVLLILGIPDGPVSFNAFGLLVKRRIVAASPIGGIAQTQEMLDFCAEHGIVSDIELIPISRVNEAYKRILNSDVRYRFVIDMASLRAE